VIRDFAAWPLLGLVVFWAAYELLVADVDNSNVLFCREIGDMGAVVVVYTLIVVGANLWIARGETGVRQSVTLVWNLAATSLVMWWAYIDVLLDHACNE